MRLVLDHTACRLDGGRVLLAGSPLTFFRLGPTGQRVVDAIAAGQDVPASARPLTDRLIDAGAAHPRPSGERFTVADVTVVIPVHGHNPSAALDAVGTGRGGGDRGRRQPAARHRPGRHPGGRHRPAPRRQPGPGGRPHDRRGHGDHAPGGLPRRRLRTGRRLAGAPARPLRRRSGGSRRASHRHRAGARHARSLRRGRAARSTSARWRPGSRRRRGCPTCRPRRWWSAWRRWRTSAGSTGRCAWERTSTWSGAWRSTDGDAATNPAPWSPTGHGRRWGDSSASASATAVRRPRWTSATPARSRRSSSGHGRREVGVWPPWATLPPAQSSAWCPQPGSVGPSPRSRSGTSWRSGLAWSGLLRGGEQLASIATRAWWPVALIAGITVRRLRAPLAVAAVLPPLIDWVRTVRASTTRLDPARYLALRLLDDGAYGAGVWAGAIEARSAGALLPGRLRVRRALTARRRRPEELGRR